MRFPRCCDRGFDSEIISFLASAIFSGGAFLDFDMMGGMGDVENEDDVCVVVCDDERMHGIDAGRSKAACLWLVIATRWSEGMSDCNI